MHDSLAQMELRLAEIGSRIARARVLVMDQRKRLELLNRNGREPSHAEAVLDALAATLDVLEAAGDQLIGEADAMVRHYSTAGPLWMESQRAIPPTTQAKRGA